MKTMNGISHMRGIIGNILILLAVLLLADVAIVMTHKINTVVLKSDYQEIFVYELILCAILLLFALDVRFGLFVRTQFVIVRIVGWMLRILIAALAAVIVFFCGKVIAGSVINNAGQAENAIVLGLALENGKPTDDLLSRLNTARNYLEKYPSARLILTGGNPDESGHTEAQVMHDILVERGVPETQMVLEDTAKFTKENFRRTATMIDPEKPVVLISSNYHMDRASSTAKEAGFTRVLRLPAPSSLLSFGASMKPGTIPKA